MNRPTVLVTGGAGYIGSHACKALAVAGYLPVTYDSLVRGNRSAVKWGPLEVGDIGDNIRLAEVFALHRPVAVMHFAAYAYVGESTADPALYYRNNITGSLRLLDSMRVAGVNRIIFSSTCATYGLPATLPISEDAPQQPINPYGTSKLIVEKALADYATSYDMRAVALRYFNAAGADPDGDIGENHDPETHLIPLVLKAAADSDHRIGIFGDDYPTADGTCIRDYTHVSDLADAHVRALDRTSKQAGFSAFNLGSGSGHSVREIIDAVQRHTGRHVNVDILPRRRGDPANLVANPTRARHELGWEPTRSSLDEMIGSAWRWASM